MIVTVTLNPCIHHLLAYEDPEDGRIVRQPVRSFFQPGGKGLNAARVIAAMGGEVLALTTHGGLEGGILLREVENSGVPVKSVEVSRPTRISTGLYNMTRPSFMELLEPGIELTKEEVDRLFKLVLDSLSAAPIVSLNGSSPCRETDDFFQKAADAARKAGCMVVVDTYSKSLVNAVKAVPHMVKLNVDEIKISFGFEVNCTADIFTFARKLQAEGIEHVLITDGSKGSWLFTGPATFRLSTPAVRELHAIGSGDAMLGALLARLEKGDTLEEACRWGAAAGAANAGRLEVCRFAPVLVEELLPSVVLERVDTIPD